MVEVVAFPTVTPLGHSKPTHSCEWLRHSVAAPRYLAVPLNQVLGVKMACVDLTQWNIERSIYQLLQDGTRKFCDENSGVLVSCLAVIGDSERGRYWSCIETQENSANQVEKYRRHGWYGSDEMGEFNNSPADFRYPMLSQWAPFAWSESIELASGDDFEFEFAHVSEDGEKTSGNNTEVDKYIHDLIVRVLKKYSESDDFRMLNRIEPFRLGSWMVDSVNRTFWVYKSSRLTCS